MTLIDEVRASTTLLARAMVDSPFLCARAIVCTVLGISWTKCLILDDHDISPGARARIQCMQERLVRGEPLAYVLGQREFYGRNFLCAPGTLIPRPESELLIELAGEFCPAHDCAFADLGAGTGCLGISLALEHPGWSGIMVELHVEALEMAARNLAKHQAPVQLLRGDIFSLPLGSSCMDLVIANPPYIGYDEQADVMPQVLAHEPHQALFSGKDGLDHLSAIIRQTSRILRPGGWLILEHGSAQGNRVRGLLETAGFEEVAIHRDLAGHERAATGQIPGSSLPE